MTRIGIQTNVTFKRRLFKVQIPLFSNNEDESNRAMIYSKGKDNLYLATREETSLLLHQLRNLETMKKTYSYGEVNPETGRIELESGSELDPVNWPDW